MKIFKLWFRREDIPEEQPKKKEQPEHKENKKAQIEAYNFLTYTGDEQKPIEEALFDN